jgi:hypothetical protein
MALVRQLTLWQKQDWTDVDYVNPSYRMSKSGLFRFVVCLMCVVMLARKINCWVVGGRSSDILLRASYFWRKKALLFPLD